MATQQDKGGKADNCWRCATRLDQPHDGVAPEPHGCGKGDCVRCPKCGSGICEYDPGVKAERTAKADKAAKLKGMAKNIANGNGAPAGGSGGSGGSGGDPKDPKDYLPAVDAFPLHVFPAAISRYIKETARAYGCPLDFPALAALVNAAAAVGNTREIEVKASYTVTAAIYAGVVAGPGATKTPVLKAVSAPVDRRQEELLTSFRRQWAKYQQAKEACDREAREERKNAKKAGKLKVYDPAAGPAGGLAQFDDQAAPGDRAGGLEKPFLRRVLSCDTTVEALCLILAENARGLLLKRDELVAWVRGMDMYRKGKGTDRQFYLSAYSGAPFVLDRKSNTDRIPIIVPRPFLCVLGGLAPDMLPEFEDEQGREDGFVDRILWSYPDVAKYVPWTEESVSEEAQQAWQNCLERLWALQACEQQGQFAPKAVGLLPAAKRAWIDFYNAITGETAADDFPARLVGPWRKLRDYGARLALVIHELRCACGECRNEEMVEEASVIAAAELIGYFKAHAVRVHAAMRGKTDLPEADAALVAAVAKLVTAENPRWAGNAKKLREDLGPHAGDARNLPRWPSSPEAMGHAIRRVAGHLAKDHGIKVTLPPASDKTRTLLIEKQPPKPPKPPEGGASHSTDMTCASGGSGQSQNPTAQTAQEDAASRAVRAVDPDANPKPPEAQPPKPEDVTDASGGLGGLGGSPGDGDDADEIEDDAI
jgi:hypothetical protein